MSKIVAGANESLPPTFGHDKKKILQALKGSHLVFIIAGLGGETGTFWAPVIAEMCCKSEILTVAMISMPLFNEPSQPRRWAEKGIEKLSTLADAVIRVDLNEYDFTLSPESDFGEVYGLAHERILDAIKGITDLTLLPNFIGIDLEDLRSIFNKKGLAVFQVGIAEGKDRAKKAVQMAVAGLLDRGIRLADLQSVLVSFTFGSNGVPFEEVSEAVEFVMEDMDDQASILWGMREDETLGEKFIAIVLAIGGKYENPGWAKNIFCQFENNKLTIELEMLTREMNCTVRLGEPFTPDLIATPYFISIVDRNLIGEECWNLFLRYCRETKDDTPLIVLDDLTHLELPDHKNILLVDLKTPQAFEEIKSAIRKIGS